MICWDVPGALSSPLTGKCGWVVASLRSRPPAGWALSRRVGERTFMCCEGCQSISARGATCERRREERRGCGGGRKMMNVPADGPPSSSSIRDGSDCQSKQKPDVNCVCTIGISHACHGRMLRIIFHVIRIERLITEAN